jgi:hypothetical protein
MAMEVALRGLAIGTMPPLGPFRTSLCDPASTFDTALIAKFERVHFRCPALKAQQHATYGGKYAVLTFSVKASSSRETAN